MAAEARPGRHAGPQGAPYADAVVLLGFWLVGFAFVGWFRWRSRRWSLSYVRNDVVAGLLAGTFLWAVFRVAF